MDIVCGRQWVSFSDSCVLCTGVTLCKWFSGCVAGDPHLLQIRIHWDAVVCELLCLGGGGSVRVRGVRWYRGPRGSGRPGRHHPTQRTASHVSHWRGDNVKFMLTRFW